ncbi:beta-lactamase class A [Crossiella equi]|uniref:Beta-lactamase class A n=1 Tax=Crossiella equi TaxID=130796 RepID=A0ABS5A7U5_9PSEU|nr:serine hydrolase [Crossiella equi]MBP2472322.1 beta-lactamase class A [Crossiella equi]
MITLLRELRARLAEGGLTGSFLVRDLDSGTEIGIDPEVEYPVASLVKVPLALAVCLRLAEGTLDGARQLDLAPGRATTPGPTDLGKFRHPARVAVDDLLYLSTALSDNLAADALFGLVPPAEVHRAVLAAGVHGLAVRHLLGDLVRTPAETLAPADTHLAHSLAIGAGTPGRGHPVPQLDVSRANSGTARALVDLLHALWRPSTVPAPAAARVRELMGDNVIRHRLTPDFASDASRWSAKTGTLLNLRHEIGVVEHEDGATFAVAALTESRVPAVVQPAAEALMGQVARALHDHLRGWTSDP